MGLDSKSDDARQTFKDPHRPDLKGIATLIKEGNAKKILVMTGAGTSTSAGIPDFRSPETGLYANLQRFDLPYPEAIFQLDFFHEKPEPFFTLAKELFPGNYKPTLTHIFFTLLHQKNLLLRVFTQNIDTLERAAGLPDDKIIEAHGSFASSRCTKCKKTVSTEEMRERIMQSEVVRCRDDKCVKKTGGKGGLVKPDIVFFGEGLQDRFFNSLSDFRKADLLIVMGTSLQVQPFAALVDRVTDDCPRLLVNLERVGEMASEVGDFESSFMSRFNIGGFDFDGMMRGGKKNARDVLWLGKCDDGVLELARECGWEEELIALRDKVWKEWESQHKDLKAMKEGQRGNGTVETAPPKEEEPAVKQEEMPAAKKEEEPALAEAERKADSLAADLSSKMKDLKVEEGTPSTSSSGTESLSKKSDPANL